MNEKAWVEYETYMKRQGTNLKSFNIRKDAHILDLGCGHGLNLKRFKQLGYFNMKGIDISESFINECKRQGFDALVCDMKSLDFESEVFDCVFARGVFYHINKPDYETVLKEVRRVIKKGGFFCMIDIKPCLARKVVDFMTFYFPVFGVLKLRRIMIREEYKTYKEWLENYSYFLNLLKKYFNIIFYKKTLFWDYIKVVPRSKLR